MHGHRNLNLINFRSTETAADPSTSPGDWKMAKYCFFGIIQRLQNKAPSCFGDFYMKTEEIQKFETPFSSGTKQILLQMQIEVTELQKILLFIVRHTQNSVQRLGYTTISKATCSTHWGHHQSYKNMVPYKVLLCTSI